MHQRTPDCASCRRPLTVITVAPSHHQWVHRAAWHDLDCPARCYPTPDQQWFDAAREEAERG